LCEMCSTSGRDTMYSEKFKWKPLRRLKYRNRDNTDVGLYKPECDYMHWIQVTSERVAHSFRTSTSHRKILGIRAVT